MNNIELIKLDPRAVVPSLQTSGAAGFDLRACLDEEYIVIKPGQKALIPTGIAMHIKDPGYAAMILPRSSMGHKRGITLGNTVGLIDSDYQGELMVSMQNNSDVDFVIDNMLRIAQLVFVKIGTPVFSIVEDFDNKSVRAAGGFGSTGE